MQTCISNTHHYHAKEPGRISGKILTSILCCTTVWSMCCFKAVFRCYQMDCPDYEFYCTYQAARRAFPNAENHQLHTISMLCGFRLENHHHALADAEACAWIAREIL